MKTQLKKVFCLLLAIVLLMCCGCTVVTGSTEFYSVTFKNPDGSDADLRKHYDGWLEELLASATGDNFTCHNPITRVKNQKFNMPGVLLHDVDLVTFGNQELVREKHLLGWDVTPSATFVAYEPGEEYSHNQDITMYAVYSDAPDTHADKLKLEIIEGDPEAGTVDSIRIICTECGCDNPQVSLEAFSKAYRAEDWFANRKKIVRAYLAYYGLNQEVLEYLQKFDMDSKDYNRILSLQKQQADAQSVFGKVASDTSTIAALEADHSELVNGWASQSYVTRDWFTAAGVLDFLDCTFQAAEAAGELQQIYEGQELSPDKIQTLIAVVQRFTDFMENSTYYAVMFDALATTMEVFFDRYEKRAYLIEYNGVATISPNDKNGPMAAGKWQNIANVDRWEEGPTLEEVAAKYDQLTPEGKKLVNEYIEFRINYECEQALKAYGMNLETYANYMLDPAKGLKKVR